MFRIFFKTAGFIFPLIASTHGVLADCESDARAAMMDVRHPVAMRQNIVTTMGDTKIRSMALTTPDNRGMAMDENGNPVSLWIGNKFYTTTDQGKTWKLLSETTDAAQQEFLDGLKSQAEKATNISCEYDVDLDGKQVHHFSLDYELHSNGMAMKGEYWIDAETSFPWRVRTVSPHNVIVQDNVPEPNAEIPDP